LYYHPQDGGPDVSPARASKPLDPSVGLAPPLFSKWQTITPLFR